MTEDMKKVKSPLIWIVLILVIAAIGVGVGAWVMLRGGDADPVNDETQRTVEEEEESVEFQTGVEMDFEKTTAVDPIQGKSQETYDLVISKLEKVFPEGVKLRQTSTSNSRYMANRILTEQDVTSLRDEFEADGFTIESVDEKSLIVEKGRNVRLRINLYDIGSPDRAEIIITHY